MNPSARRSDLPAAVAYLADVDSQLQSLPAAERDELIADLRDHIDASGGEDLTDVLARLGDPAGFAHTLSDTEPAPAPSSSPSPDREHIFAVLRVIAVLLTLGSPIGWLFVDHWFAAAWLVGVIALWLLPPWQTRERTISTLIGPVSVAVIVLLRVRRWVTAVDCGPADCVHLAPWPIFILGYVIFATFLVGSAWMAARLLLLARRPSQQPVSA